MHRLRILTSLAIILGVSLGSTARADHLNDYRVNFTTLNNSGVSGFALLTIDTNAQTLSVNIEATGLEPNQAHMMHIHGLIGGDGTSTNPSLDSQTPTLADDADGDGFIEVLEGVPQYGDILLPLETQMAPGGVISYQDVFDLTDDSLFGSPVTGNDYTAANLMPLDFREIVIHGLSVDGSAGANTDGEIDGTAGYKGLLPVAAGEIQSVPEPGTLVLAGLGLMGVLAARRRSS